MSAIQDIDREALLINLLESSSDEDDESIGLNTETQTVERNPSSSNTNNNVLDHGTSNVATSPSETVPDSSSNVVDAGSTNGVVAESNNSIEVIEIDSVPEPEPKIKQESVTNTAPAPAQHDKHTLETMLMQTLFATNSRYLNKAIRTLDKHSRRNDRLWPDASPFIKKILNFTPPSVITNIEDESIQFSGRISGPDETRKKPHDPIPETFNSAIVMMKKIFPFMQDEIALNIQQESSAMIRDTVNNKVHRLEVVDIRKVESDKNATAEDVALYEYTLESVDSDIPACGYGSLFVVHCKTWEDSSTCLAVVYSKNGFDSLGNMSDNHSYIRLYICAKNGACGQNTGYLPTTSLPKMYRDKSVERQLFHMLNVGSIISHVREFEAIKSLKYVKYHIQSSVFCSKADESIVKQYEDITRKSMSKPKKPQSVPPNLWEHLESKLNVDQLCFIDKAMRDYRGFNNVLLLQGPPGTGKSTTIVGLVSALVNGTCPSPGKKAKGAKICVGSSIPGAAKLTASCRILVCAPSNTAVDELAWRLHKEGFGPNGKKGDLNVVRFGWLDEDQTKAEYGEEKSRYLCHINLDFITESAVDCSESHVSPKKSPRKSSRRGNSKLRQAELARCHVVCTTLNSSGSRSFINSIAEISKDSTSEFDAVIIDEACQASEPSSYIPFKYNPKLIVMIGDPQQLPVVLFSQTAHKGNLGRSLFERLQSCGLPVDRLHTQYRMHPDIVDFSSQKFYNGTLVTSPYVLNRPKPVWHNQSCFPPIYFWNMTDASMNKDRNNSFYNKKEKDFIIDRILLNLSKMLGRSTIEIGVITFYSSQVRMIKDSINRMHASKDFKQSIKVSTVDGFQGGEKDIIILSCVRGLTDTKSSSVGFLGDYRRVNVSLTRARQSLWIVGNANILSGNKFWRSFLGSLRERNCIGDCKNFRFDHSSNKRPRDYDNGNNENYSNNRHRDHNNRNNGNWKKRRNNNWNRRGGKGRGGGRGGGGRGGDRGRGDRAGERGEGGRGDRDVGGRGNNLV